LPAREYGEKKTAMMERKQNLYGLTAGQCELPAREYGEKKKNSNDGTETKPLWSHSWSM
jgi:hypothetical protein